MLRQSGMALLLAAALTATGWAADNDPAQEPSQQQSAQMGSPEMSQATSANIDTAFAAVLVSHARLQRQISDLVAEKATNPQIKQAAQDISKDYQQLSDRVQAAAKQAGITINPDRMLQRDQAVLSYMQQLPVDRLERDYVFHEAGATRTNQLFAQWVANHAQKPEIRQAAQEVASKLQQRDQQFQQLADAEVGAPTAQPAGGQMKPGQ